MIALIDYGLSNLRSVEKALSSVGAQTLMTSDPQKIREADKIVLPGVGAFGDGMKGLESRQLINVLIEKLSEGTPLLGICLGMQLFFESSEESKNIRGLGFMKGTVKKFNFPEIKIPHTGWNRLIPQKESLLLKNISPGSYAYFNHGFYCAPENIDNILTSTNYGLEYASAVESGNLLGIQCHPEKSQDIGLQILDNFVHLY